MKISSMSTDMAYTRIFGGSIPPLGVKMSEIEKEYQKLINLLRAQKPYKVTPEQRIDWAYGMAVMENPEITREMIMQAVKSA